PRVKIPFSAFVVEQSQFRRGRTAFLFLIVVVGKQSLPGIADDCKFVIRIEYGRAQFSRIAREILVVLPLDAEGPIDAVAGGLGNVNEDALMRMTDHGCLR